jgi:hypothetical protein
VIREGKFEALTGSPESSILDFKLCMYKFEDELESAETAKFVKDVISLANTIRTETSYIIIGVQANEDGSKEFLGIDKFIDDAILQDKIKDKVSPRPVFKSYVLKVGDKQFGIIEIPITRYESPIIAKKRMKGIEPDKVYYRLGSINTEATIMDIIKINDWLRSLPDFGTKSSINSEVTQLMKRLTEQTEKLSTIFVDILSFARSRNLANLTAFCISELTGFAVGEVRRDQEEFKYRIHKVILSVREISVRGSGYIRVTSEMVRQEMEKDKDHFFSDEMFFNQTISYIENMLFREGDGIITIAIKYEDVFFDKEHDVPIYAYLFKSMLSSLYNSIRQKAIDELMKV